MARTVMSWSQRIWHESLTPRTPLRSRTSTSASVIGGVATTGGIGTPLGAILGAGIIAIIENIIVLFGVSPYWQGVVSGVIVVLAISFDAISRRYIRKEL